MKTLPSKVKSCKQCAVLYINGVFCHETGCPNQGKRWDADNGEWVCVRECRECGSEVLYGEGCCP